MRRYQGFRASLPLLALVAASLLGTACVGIGVGVKGSGKIVDEEVQVDSFDRIDIGSAFKVQVSLGERDALTLHVDDNIRDRIEYGVSGGTLRLRLKPRSPVRDATLRADVFVRRLREVRASGASNVQIDSELTGDAVAVGLSGASEVSGRANVGALRAELSGASKMRFAGKASGLTVQASGASGLDLGELEAERLDVQLSGASKATVSATGTISADLSGASSLRYKGSPRFERQQTSGSSSIERL
ncbi:MAG TPA: head GIN domain-containing protein [Actinomycetes bacterium]|jgi:hypothetical protein|nr:head GIN domain-containing protein [Actinomycetes bacterium]